jgi:hypothetical protein
VASLRACLGDREVTQGFNRSFLRAAIIEADDSVASVDLYSRISDLRLSWYNNLRIPCYRDSRIARGLTAVDAIQIEATVHFWSLLPQIAEVSISEFEAVSLGSMP